jgi:hypothetical protein
MNEHETAGYRLEWGGPWRVAYEYEGSEHDEYPMGVVLIRDDETRAEKWSCEL